MPNILPSNPTPTQHVFVTVAGGVAYVADAPVGVTVHIVDYDNLNADFEGAFNQLSPEERAFYTSAEKGIAISSGAESV